MKAVNQILVFGLSLMTLAGPSLAQPEMELESWAKKKIEDTLNGCSHRSPKEVFNNLKKLEVEYSTKVDQIPLSLLKGMPSDSEFIEMGQVIFPSMLPKGFPARLLYMACDDEHRAFLGSKNTADSKENLAELKDCFRRSYRIETPKTVAILLKCYEELNASHI